MHFSEGYRPKFDDFMNRLGRGVSAEAAFRESFGKTPREVEKDLKEYMQGTRFRGGLVDVKLEKSAEKPFVEAAPEVELGLTLAELAGGGRSADGKAALLQLAREYPKDAEVAEALGYEAWRSGDREEALRRFEHAIDLGSGNAKLHYECAGLSQEQGRPLSRVTALLEKTTELDPDHRDAWFRLGFAHFAQQRFAEAVIAWGHISRVTSEEAGPFFRSVAYANYRIGRKEAAQRAAGRALEYAKTPDDREKAQELVTFVSADPLRESAAARAAAEPDRAPVLQRRPEPAAAPASSPSAPRLLLHVASGTFTELDCQGAEARLHVMVQNKEHLFLLRPNTAAIKGTEGGIFEFTCGLQKARPVVVEFETSDSLPAGVTGLVRVLDLQ
jgi:tetratricopeptide (TPR) repeat protein